MLLPLLRLCPTAAPDLQQLVLLNLTLWLGHSQDDANHRLLSKLFGWQLPICELLNDCAAADDGSAQSAHTTRAFCMQLLAHHLLRAIVDPDSGAFELTRTVSFLEAYALSPNELKRELFSKVLDLLREPASAPPTALDAAGATVVWANVLRFALLVEESFYGKEQSRPASSKGGSSGGGSGFLQRIISGGVRPASVSTSSRHVPVDVSGDHDGDSDDGGDGDEGGSPSSAGGGVAASGPQLCRNDRGGWVDRPLAMKLLQLLDPLVVKGMVDPAASAALHLSSSAMAAAGGGGRTRGQSDVLGQAVRSIESASKDVLRIFREGAAFELPAGRTRTNSEAYRELPDALCDILLRVQLLLLREDGIGEAAPPQPPPRASQGENEFDVGRQMEELLQHAACWCPKPCQLREGVADETAAKEKSREQMMQRQALASAVARLVQAVLGRGGAPAAVVAAVVPVLQELVRSAATAEELEMNAALGRDVPPAQFLEEAASWKGLLVRLGGIEALAAAIRALEEAGAPGHAAAERR